MGNKQPVQRGAVDRDLDDTEKDVLKTFEENDKKIVILFLVITEVF